ncbi:DUF134 domain-containing protein [Candidatus Thorarchaeota archaeon]|nr:MAG: DUF134 domain-containing protein [Candidatus Thorarchaeota archaeon]
MQMTRKRKGGRGRFPIQPKIKGTPHAKLMAPEPKGSEEPIYIDLAEVEVLRLVDLEGMYQEQAGSAMGVSRGTIWRLLVSAREKVTRSIVEGRQLIIGLPAED